MKIAVYHNLPSGGAKRSLYELISRSALNHDYMLYRPAIEENESYMDLRPLVRSEHVFGFQGLEPDMLAHKNIIERRKIMRKFYRLETEIANAINKSDVDVVFVTSCMFTHSPGVLCAINKPSIYYLHEPRRQSFEFNLSPLMERLSRVGSRGSKVNWLLRQSFDIDAMARDIKSVRAASRVLCNSFYTHESALRSYGVDTEVCYFGVDQRFKSESSASKQSRESILVVGALHPNKNQLLMIEAIGLMPEKKRPTLECVFDRSEESYKQQLINGAKELGVDLVLSYRLPDSELVKKYASATAVACLAELEPFGFTPLEANLAGTPVIALKEGGYRETVIDGETGLFVSRDSHIVKDAVMQVSEKNWDQAKLRKHAGQWSWQRTVAQYERTLQELDRG
ncbi:MAG: hypothetical protein QG632_553 [Candidatus Dependentiae bacterium]|nr:hypothetical protein [Candidatus Dependentiae bacterium]